MYCDCFFLLIFNAFDYFFLEINLTYIKDKDFKKTKCYALPKFVLKKTINVLSVNIMT